MYTDFSSESLYEILNKPKPSDDLRTCEGIVRELKASNISELHSELLSLYIYELWLSESNLCLSDQNKEDLQTENLCRETTFTDIYEIVSRIEVNELKTNISHTALKIYNLKEACFWLFDPEWKKRTFDTDFIQEIHSLVMNNIEGSEAGKIRTVVCWSSGSFTYYVVPSLIPKKLKSLCEFVQNELENPEHQTFRWRFQLACFFVVDFLTIHPFCNGNGRVARLLFSHILRDFTFVPISFHHIRSSEGNYEKYIDSLKCSRYMREPSPFIEYALTGVRQNLSALYDRCI